LETVVSAAVANNFIRTLSQRSSETYRMQLAQNKPNVPYLVDALCCLFTIALVNNLQAQLSPWVRVNNGR